MIETGIFVAAMVLFAAWVQWHQRRVRSAVKAWADQNHCQILRYLWAFYRVAPFLSSFFGRQTVRRVLVRDSKGRERIVWLLLGDFFVGLLDDRVVGVSWES